MIHLQCICMNNNVRHMETKLAGGGEEETAPHQLNGMQRYRGGTYMKLQRPTPKPSAKQSDDSQI